MKFKNFYYFTIFLYLISSGTSYSIEQPDIKNLIIHKEKKIIKGVYFFDSLNNKKTLEEFKNNISLINFWATWCAPCKEEMPSLDSLISNPYLDNIEIFAINVGKDSLEKSNKFFEDLNFSIIFTKFFLYLGTANINILIKNIKVKISFCKIL